MKNFAVIYVVDITEARRCSRALPSRLHATCALWLTRRCPQVPDFNTMYELFDPCTVMFFFRNKARAPRRASAATEACGDTPRCARAPRAPRACILLR